MSELLTILSQPIVQLGGVVSALIFLNSLGFDIPALFRRFLGTDGGEIKSDNRNAMQSTLSTLELKMDRLSSYYNHETTEAQQRVEAMIAKLDEKMEEHVRQHDRTNYLLEDIKNNGIKCRNN